MVLGMRDMTRLGNAEPPIGWLFVYCLKQFLESRTSLGRW